MSIQSKAKRDANRKKAARQRVVTGTLRPAIEAHAELRHEDGTLLGGIARRDGDWELGLDGKMVGGSTSAATILAMIKRAAAMLERTGTKVTLNFSDALRDAANEEARAQGLSLEQFEARLDDDMTGSRPAATSEQSGSAAH
ncbi:hypothetical protein ACW7G0_05635 [Lysobacter sp. A286]